MSDENETEANDTNDDSDASADDGADEELVDDPSDRYEREETLGSGGLGTVYRASQHRLSRDVAIKEVRNIFEVFADLDRDDIVERFAAVTEDQADIAHPNVARVFDLETDEDYPYAVTEYAQNGTLRRFIDTEDRRLSSALQYFLQVLNGLSTAHDADLVHGGIKPENILIDDAGNAVVTDFGHSGVVDVSEGSNQVYVGVGTVNYMPPEQFEDPTAATEASDIYSAGIMFYEMLTGKVPGRRSPMPSSYHDAIPAAIDDIFDRMTMDRIEDRFDTVDEVLEAIYESDAILDLLDRRSAVLFYADPVTSDASAGQSAEILLGQTRADDTSDDTASADRDDDVAEQADSSDQATDKNDVGTEQSDVIDRDNSASTDSDDSASNTADDFESDASPNTQSNDAPEAPSNSADDAGASEDEGAEASNDEPDEEDEVLEKLEDYGELFDDED